MKSVRDVAVLVVAMILQATFLYRFEIAGIRPDLLVAFVVYLGWMRGPIAGTAGGFLVGLIQDLDAPGPLGLNALSKTIVGFAVAKAGFRVHRANVGVRFAFFLFAMLAHDVIYFAASSLGDFGLFAKQMLTIAVPSALYTALVVLVILALVENVWKRPLLADES
ncbi:MAG TPA: rod shape-determining protein MreD [Candidatus Omnitrophota bacterium]|nr:rod shape-determining protein MreD [Candidatus Omnitrophota bacterium]